jgi:hypothetical protein
VGVIGYNVYRRPVSYGFSYLSDKINAVSISGTSYTDNPPLILNNEWYYCITAKTATEESPFQPAGVTWLPYTAFTGQTDINMPYLPNNINMDFYFDEIRRRHTWMIENDGEDITFYKRRWEGERCPCVQEEGEEGNYNCLLCFGTGILGGYYLAYTIKIRYGSIPIQLVRYDKEGLIIEHKPSSWTLWTPRLTEHDLVVRFDGVRYDVNDLAQSTWRGLPLHQDFNLQEVVPTDIRYQVNNTAILAALGA